MPVRLPDRLAPDSVDPSGAAPPSLAAQEDRASTAAVASARTAPLREIFTRSPCQTLTQSGEHGSHGGSVPDAREVFCPIGDCWVNSRPTDRERCARGRVLRRRPWSAFSVI